MLFGQDKLCYISFDLFAVIASIYRYKNEKQKCECKDSFRGSVGISIQLLIFQEIINKQPSSSVLGKGVLKICSKFTGKHPRQSVISIKMQSNFTEITLHLGCFPVNVLNIFGTLLFKNTFGWLLHHLFLKKCCINVWQGS